MGHFRYTINELSKPDHKDYLTDEKLLIAMINERMSFCTNHYAPLYKRLQQLRANIESKIKETD